MKLSEINPIGVGWFHPSETHLFSAIYRGPLFSNDWLGAQPTLWLREASEFRDPKPIWIPGTLLGGVSPQGTQ